MTIPNPMKTKRSVQISVIVLLAMLGSAARAHARHFIAGISPSLNSGERQATWSAMLDFTVLEMQPGDRLDVYDATALQPLIEWLTGSNGYETDLDIWSKSGKWTMITIT